MTVPSVSLSMSAYVASISANGLGQRAEVMNKEKYKGATGAPLETPWLAVGLSSCSSFRVPGNPNGILSLSPGLRGTSYPGASIPAPRQP